MAFKVVFTDPPNPALTIQKEFLSSIGAEAVAASSTDEDTLAAECADADAIVNRFAKITDRVISNLSHCKLIIRTGIGVDTIDLESATRHQVKVSCVPDYCRDEVADHTVALSLALCRKVSVYNSMVKSGKWAPLGAGFIPRLSSCTYGILGFGNIAQRVAKRMQAFGCKILAYDPYLPDEVFAAMQVQRASSIEEVFQNGDFVSLNLPLTDETYHLVNENTLSMMKEHAFLINTARGPLVSEEALYKALRDGQISGAGLDVLETEPLPENHPFHDLENVLLSPHAAFYSCESLPDLDKKTMEEVIRALNDQPLKTWINKF